MRRVEERAHRSHHLVFASRSIVATGRQREGLRQSFFRGQGEIDLNPFHTCSVRRSEDSTKTVIRLGR